MKDNQISDFDGGYIITKYTGSEEHVEIPETIDGVAVKVIGKDVFSCDQTIKSITIPDSVTEIDDRAFDRCENLFHVIISDSVEKIGRYAFSSCKGLTNITLPSNITEIDDCAFQSNIKMTSIVIPSSVTKIGDGAFAGCRNLTIVSLSEGITEIQDFVFHKCKKLMKIAIPDSITYIGKNAFHDCKELISINIPDKVTHIDKEAFYRCDALESITIPASVTHIGERAFWGCNNLAKVNIYVYAERGRLLIEQNAFPENTTINYIEDLITGLSERQFCRPADLLDHDDVKDFEPIFVSKNKETALEYCKLLRNKRADEKGEKEWDLEEWIFSPRENEFEIEYTSETECKITRCNSRASDYVFIGDKINEVNVSGIGNNAFSGCMLLEEVTIFSNNMKFIEKDAFYRCDRLARVDIYADKNNITIDPNAFPEHITVNFISEIRND